MKYISLLLTVILFACSASKSTADKGKPVLRFDGLYLISSYASDKNYGYTEENPVMVGGVREGPSNERRYLNSLAGPNGEDLKFYRAGSCCPFKSKNGFDGVGLLDRYRVYWEGSKDTLSIYINMYDEGTLFIPHGLTSK